jgi:flavin reductase (DIM6/NTAB) family NADH-FMN oxidoreductase RutF
VSTVVEPVALRAALGHFATGVTVVTARDGAGAAFGTTANALTSVSLDPPLLLVCLRDASETLTALRASGRFAVNVLGAGQHELAGRFARRAAAGTWAGVAVRRAERDSTGGRCDGTDTAEPPLLEGALATLQCALHDVADGGDHRIVVGRVLAVEHPAEHREPLLFYRGSFAGLRPPEPRSRA